jgi:hypothetical protein
VDTSDTPLTDEQIDIVAAIPVITPDRNAAMLWDGQTLEALIKAYGLEAPVPNGSNESAAALSERTSNARATSLILSPEERRRRAIVAMLSNATEYTVPRTPGWAAGDMDCRSLPGKDRAKDCPQHNRIGYMYGGKKPGDWIRPAKGRCQYAQYHGIDCSGLVRTSAKFAGLDVPDGAVNQGDANNWKVPAEWGNVKMFDVTAEVAADPSGYRNGDVIQWNSKHVHVGFVYMEYGPAPYLLSALGYAGLEVRPVDDVLKGPESGECLANHGEWHRTDGTVAIFGPRILPWEKIVAGKDGIPGHGSYGRPTHVLRLGCKVEDAKALAPCVDKVTVASVSASVKVGETVTLTATALDGDGHEIVGRKVEWESSSPGIATVSGGVVTGIAKGGPVDIAATIDGVTGHASVMVDSSCEACVAPKTCQPDGTCKSPCEVTPCTAPATCQPDGTCEVICADAGFYQGRWWSTAVSDESGSWSAVINSRGSISGNVSNVHGANVVASGTSDCGGNFQFVAGGLSTGARFSGSISSGGGVSGSWSAPGGDSGGFSGAKSP